MIPFIVIAATSLLTYTVAYLSTLTPETSLFANQEAVMRMRIARYAGRSRFAEIFFSPMAFLDLMIRRKYWIQCDSNAMESENQLDRPHLNVNMTRITDEAIARFQVRLPNCVVWNGK